MIIKRAAQVGNPAIRRKSLAVARVSSTGTRRIIRNLIDSMRYHELVGMAAPQIGINVRIFVSEIRKTEARGPKVLDPVRIFINPKIVGRSSLQAEEYEGCGSVANAGLFGKVRRSENIVVSAKDKNGRRFKLRATGLLARIIQHENDHLDGIIFLDRVSDMKSLMGRAEYLKRKV